LLIVTATVVVVVKERVIVRTLHFSTTRLLHEMRVISLEHKDRRKTEEKRRGSEV